MGTQAVRNRQRKSRAGARALGKHFFSKKDLTKTTAPEEDEIIVKSIPLFPLAWDAITKYMPFWIKRQLTIKGLWLDLKHEIMVYCLEFPIRTPEPELTTEASERRAWFNYLAIVLRDFYRNNLSIRSDGHGGYQVEKRAYTLEDGETRILDPDEIASIYWGDRRWDGESTTISSNKLA